MTHRCLLNIPIPKTTLDTTFTPEQEKAVLMEIFHKTGGNNWKCKTHWGNQSVSHCFWHGITCDRTSRYVISISLVRNNLIGTLPGILWKLRNLQGLCMGGNNGLLGSVDDIAFNKLSGRIPGERLVQMRSLVKIQLCCQMGEPLSGKIPDDIGNLTNLQVLSLGENRLYGPIPKSIGKLKKLWFLELESSYLGSGFENLLNLTSLRYMMLYLSGLKGTLHDDFGLYFPAMIECVLKGNNFTGKIPSTIGNMKFLKNLNLEDNNFSGKIPKSIGSMPRLQVAFFSGNRLTSLEKGMRFNSKSLEVLVLSGNKHFTMRLDDLVDAMEPLMKSLRILNISECRFHGTIPKRLWLFRSLISVDLSRNRLYGELSSPTADNSLFLSNLNVSANNLSGEIPQIALISLKVLDVSKNIHMREADERGQLPNFMRVDFTTLAHKNPADKFKCPNLRLEYNNGLVIVDPSYYRYRLCICDIGYYGLRKTCLPCMRGALCNDQRPPTQSMAMNAGYWPSSRDNNVTHLVECTRALGINPLENTACNPTGTCDCGIEWVKKKNKTNIKPSTVCRKSCLCRNGSKERFCSSCEDGFYKQGMLCYACPQNNTNVYVLIALVVLTVALILVAFTFLYKRNRFLSIVFVFAQISILAVLATLQKIPGWLVELNTVALFLGLVGRGKAARGILKIGVFYFQTMDALISNTDVWPNDVLETQRYISNVFNIRFSGLACVIPQLFTPLGELLTVILLPVICIVGIWLCYCLGCAVLKLRNSYDRRFRFHNTCSQLSIVALNPTYFPIVKKTASVLARCGEDNGYHYLREAPWLNCSGPIYTMLQAFGWLALILYVIRIPFGVFLPLLRIKVAKREQLLQREQETLDSWLGSLYLPYKKQFRSYFEILLILRRLLIAFSLSFIPRASSFQTIAVCSVLLTSLCIQLVYKPFKDSYQKIALENLAETLVLLTLHFSFMNSR